jgi:hypothetical protein
MSTKIRDLYSRLVENRDEMVDQQRRWRERIEEIAAELQSITHQPSRDRMLEIQQQYQSWIESGAIQLQETDLALRQAEESLRDEGLGGLH